MDQSEPETTVTPANKGRRWADPRLGFPSGSPAEDFLIADHDVIQKLWIKIDTDQNIPRSQNVSRDDSVNGTIILSGRCMLPDSQRPLHWAVRDNRVHFEAFAPLSAHDKMTVANQVVLAYARRSEKNDLKAACIAITERGNAYIAMNTQETPTMEEAKECAESNLSRVVKHLKRGGDTVARLYVLGSLTDKKGELQTHDHLVGMCMRCVETISSVAFPGTKVTVIPANDGNTHIGLRACRSIKEVGPREAWEVEHGVLKAPSIIEFSESTAAQQRIAFEKMKTDPQFPPHPLEKLDNNATEQDINAYMLTKLTSAVRKREGQVNQIGMAIIELVDEHGTRTGFDDALQFRGPRDNSSLPAVSAAVYHAALPIPRGRQVGKVYFMGTNADGTPYNMSAEIGERLFKRVGKDHANSTEVVCIPLNEGTHREEDVVRRTVEELNPTTFSGAKQLKDEQRVK